MITREQLQKMNDRELMLYCLERLAEQSTTSETTLTLEETELLLIEVKSRGKLNYDYTGR